MKIVRASYADLEITCVSGAAGTRAGTDRQRRELRGPVGS